MAQIDLSRQVSVVGSSQKINCWGKRPNTPKITKTYFFILIPADFTVKTQFPIEIAI